MSISHHSSLPPPATDVQSPDYTPWPPDAWMDPSDKEKREIHPPKEGDRRLFDKTARLVLRYGRETIPVEEVKHHLAQELVELRNADPLIALNLLQKEGKINAESRSAYVGVYRLVSPTLKQLNDIYLGPNATDCFVEDLNRTIHEMLGENKALILKTTNKGSIFALDLDELPINGDGTPMKAFRECVRKIQDIATKKLEQHLAQRLALAQKKYASLCRQLADFTQKEQTPYSDEALNELARLQNTQNVTYETIKTLESKLSELQNGDASVDISFGLDRLGQGAKQQYVSCWNAECAANMAAVHMNGKNGGKINGNGEKPHNSLQMFQYRDLIKGSILAMQSLAPILEDFGPDDPRSGEVKPEWKKFFLLDPVSGYIQMRPNMINKYRHIDQYRLTQEYQDMGAEERNDFEERLSFFEKYYRKINVVDVLKPFVYEKQEDDLASIQDMSGYLERIQEIADLVWTTEKVVGAPHADEKKLRQKLEETSAQLERSLKDARDNVTHTTRAAIRLLCQVDGEKILVFTDNIGFGALNQGSYERAVHHLIDQLNLTDADWERVNDGKTKLDDVINDKLTPLIGTKEFERSLLSVGDVGNRYLREQEKKLTHLFGGKPIVNTDGGDETIVFFSEKRESSIPSDKEELEKILLQTSLDLHMRIAAVYGPIQFSPIQGRHGVPIITSRHRKENITYIQQIIQYAEDSHAAIKAMNERHEHKVAINALHGLNKELAIS